LHEACRAEQACDEAKQGWSCEGRRWQLARR
jgi:hypothetical protein